MKVKSSAKNTETVFSKYRSVEVTRLTYCDWNSGTKKISLKTAEDDKYVAKAKYTTKDCFWLACVGLGYLDAEKCSNISSLWVSEKYRLFCLMLKAVTCM